jgi:hypothetical protein
MLNPIVLVRIPRLPLRCIPGAGHVQAERIVVVLLYDFRVAGRAAHVILFQPV